MELLNLTFAELLAFVVPLSAAVVALYFYDRSRRRRVVSTLHFWPRRPAYPMTTRRRRLQQPWSLLLQLLAAIFILLAIADLRFSGTSQTPRHHVVILETSAWMSAPAAPGQPDTLLDLVRRSAQRRPGLIDPRRRQSDGRPGLHHQPNHVARVARILTAQLDRRQPRRCR